MTQLTFIDAEQQATSLARRATSASSKQAEQLVPWAELKVRIVPCFVRSENGRLPYSLPSLQRIHCLHWLIFDCARQRGRRWAS